MRTVKAHSLKLKILEELVTEVLKKKLAVNALMITHYD